MSTTTTNAQPQSEPEQDEGRARPYVVLQEISVIETIDALLKTADVGLSSEEWDRLRKVADEDPMLLYREVARRPSRNAHHALTQVGRAWPNEGQTPPLVAVSERMFQPKSVNVSFDPKVSIS